MERGEAGEPRCDKRDFSPGPGSPVDQRPHTQHATSNYTVPYLIEQFIHPSPFRAGSLVLAAATRHSLAMMCLVYALFRSIQETFHQMHTASITGP